MSEDTMHRLFSIYGKVGCSLCFKNVKMCSRNSGSKSGNTSNTSLHLYAESITVQIMVVRDVQTTRSSSPPTPPPRTENADGGSHHSQS